MSQAQQYAQTCQIYPLRCPFLPTVVFKSLTPLLNIPLLLNTATEKNRCGSGTFGYCLCITLLDVLYWDISLYLGT
jgi:hypothetical protein